MPLPEPLSIVGDISYHVLTADYRDSAHAVLSRAFVTLPVTQSVTGTSSEVSYMDWLEFHNYWMDHTIENGMSVMAINKADARLAGVMTVRNIDYMHPEFDKKFSDPAHPLTPLLALLGKLVTESLEKQPILKDTSQGADLWCLAVDPAYRGKKIANHLIKEAVSLIEKTKKYKWLTIEAFNHFTKKAAEKNGLEVVHTMDAKDFLWNGEILYNSVPEPHNILVKMMKVLK